MDVPTVAHNLCRACVQDLTTNKTGKAITFVNILETPDLLNKLSSCISNEFSTNIFCSKYLCMDCFQIVNEFFEFREMCEDSIHRFEERAKHFSNLKQAIIKEEYEFTDPAMTDSTNAFIGVCESGNDLQKSQRNKCQESIRRVEELQHHKDLRNCPNLNEVIVKEEYELNDQPMTLNRANESMETCQRIPATQGIKDEDLEHAVSFKSELISDEDDIEFILVDDSENSLEVLFHTPATKVEVFKNVGENCPKKRAKQEVEDSATTLVNVEHVVSTKYEPISGKDGMKVSPVDDSENESPLYESIDSQHHAGSEDKYVITQSSKTAKYTSSHTAHKTIMDKAKKLPKCYYCEKCPARFYIQSRFNAHTRKHQGLKPYLCMREGCGKSFNEWFELSRHRAQHDKKSIAYMCDQEGCNKVYKREHSLKMHKRIHPQLGVDLKSLHACDICGRAFKNSKLLENHCNRHNKEHVRPYLCGQQNCTLRFSSKHRRREHIKGQHRFKKYACPRCDMRKATECELNRHMKCHNRDRICPYSSCKAVFKSILKFRAHIRNIHLDESYMQFECRFCDLKFDKRNTLKYHEMRHTGEKPNVCSECGKGFIQPTSLRAHMKLHERSSDDIPI